MRDPSLERSRAAVPPGVKAPPSSRPARQPRQWTLIAGLLTVLVLALGSAGCDTLGADCEDDSDCDDGQICGDPQGTDASICFIPCESDSECEEDPGGGSTCQILPQASSGYCSAAD